MPRETREVKPSLILFATVTAAILVVANISSLNVALPELSRELGASQSDVQWMIDIYAFFLATLLLPAGALGDRYGRRRMLLIGIFILGAANAASLITTDVSLVIA
ncbi:MAG: MFS transporter, partial [Actinomycetota bacterium]|nr:MFS transporter [Actinomycetota bacterium]